MQIIGMRLNDSRDGTSVAEDVLAKYWPAVQKKNMIRPDGLFADALFDRQQGVLPPSGVGFTAWYVLLQFSIPSLPINTVYQGMRIHEYLELILRAIHLL